MAKTSAVPGWQLAVVILTGTVVGVVAVTCLYWARTVFIPVALAIFLTFLLAPLVTRASAVRGLEAIAFGAPGRHAGGGGAGWRPMAGHRPGHQLGRRSAEVHGEYQKEGHIAASSSPRESVTSGLDKMIQDIVVAWNPKPASRDGKYKDKENDEKPPVLVAEKQPTAVVIESESPTWLARLPALLSSLLETLGGLALALVLVIFMLLSRQVTVIRGPFFRRQRRDGPQCGSYQGFLGHRQQPLVLHLPILRKPGGAARHGRPSRRPSLPRC